MIYAGGLHTKNDPCKPLSIREELHRRHEVIKSTGTDFSNDPPQNLSCRRSKKTMMCVLSNVNALPPHSILSRKGTTTISWGDFPVDTQEQIPYTSIHKKRFIEKSVWWQICLNYDAVL
jgi:hypothetical protein